MIAHLGYIVFAYGLTAAVIGGMIGAVVLEQRRLKRELARFEDRQS